MHYSRDDLLAARPSHIRVSRAVHKTVFSNNLRRYTIVRRDTPTNTLLLTKHSMTIGLINARSIGNKAHILRDTIMRRRYGILLMTETWHYAMHDVPLKSSALAGLNIIEAARSSNNCSHVTMEVLRHL